MALRALLVASLSLSLAACEEEKPETDIGAPAPTVEAAAIPPIIIDGSSTVLPVTRSVVKLYAEHVTAEIRLSGAGTGAGLKKLCQKEITIAGASRPIREAESKLCQQANVELIELPVAFDGIAVVVSSQNDWASTISVAELGKLWNKVAEGRVKNWSDVRAGWPSKPIELYGPGRDSGTFDYFTETVVGEAGASRTDYVASEDDDVLVKGVSENKYALGYFGFSYYVKNNTRLKALAVDDGVAENGKGPIEPNPATISDGSYQPLSRPLFIYTSVEAAKRKEVNELIRFYLRAGRIVATDVGCIPLSDSLFELARKRFVSMHTGSAFQGVRSAVGITMEDLLQAETAEMAPLAQEPATARP